MNLGMRSTSVKQLRKTLRAWLARGKTGAIGDLPFLAACRKSGDVYAVYFPHPKTNKSLYNKGFAQYGTGAKALKLVGPLLDGPWESTDMLVCVGKAAMDGKDLVFTREKGLLGAGKLGKALRTLRRDLNIQGVVEKVRLGEVPESPEALSGDSVAASNGTLSELERLGLRGVALDDPAAVVAAVSAPARNLFKLLTLIEKLSDQPEMDALLPELQAVYEYLDEQLDPLDATGLLQDQDAVLAEVMSPIAYARSLPILVIPDALQRALESLDKPSILRRATKLTYAKALALFDAGKPQEALITLQSLGSNHLFGITDQQMQDIDPRWQRGAMLERWDLCVERLENMIEGQG